MAVAVLFAPSSCSLGADDEAQPASGATARVAATVDRLERATARRDWEGVCAELFTTAARRRAGGRDCPRLLRSSADDLRAPSIEIRGIDVAGERATVAVRTRAEGQPRVDDSLELRREAGGWRVEALSDR
jgi:alpha-beta hydrolase superfamily lysophospholipase